jgi:hypothetical protein
VLVPMDAAADVILSPVQPTLFRFGEVAVVRRHIFLFGCFQAGFPLLQAAGFLRAQGAVLDAIGDAILLPGFAAVYLIHARMAGIDNPGPAPAVVEVVVWAAAEPVNISPPTARIKSEFEILSIIQVQTPTEEPSSPVSRSASYERETWLVTRGQSSPLRPIGSETSPKELHCKVL